MAKETKRPDGVQTELTSVDWSQYSGTTGLEAVRSEDLGIPFLMIIQSNSPELNKIEPKFIKGAGQGDVINTLTREIVYVQGGDPIKFIPCAYDKLFMEWKPRESGGGLVKSHRDASILETCTKNTKNYDVLPSGNLIVTTAYFFGMRVKEGIDPERCVIGLSSTQGKKARTWLNLAMSRKSGNPPRVLPLFSHTYGLTTIAESNEKGSWYGWGIALGTPVTDQATIATSADIARSSLQSVNKLLDRGTSGEPESSAQY